MENAVMRAELTEGGDGEPRLRVIHEYNFEESPRDRHVGHLPLVLRMPERESDTEADSSAASGAGG
jgi:hypothetical protein